MRNWPLLNWNWGTEIFPVWLHTDEVHTAACKPYSLMVTVYLIQLEFSVDKFGINLHCTETPLYVTLYVGKANDAYFVYLFITGYHNMAMDRLGLSQLFKNTSSCGQYL